MIPGAATLALAAMLASGLAPAAPADQPEPRPTETADDRRLVTGLGLGGAYVALGTWMWLAWYKDQPPRASWRYGGDGWFGETTYAGGADKLGHVWSNLALSRLGTELLRRGGWDRLSSSLVASAICVAAFTLVEVNDGSYTEFSPGDLAANVVGALGAVAMSNWTGLDDAIDFRVQWFPSAGFRRRPSADFAEDYSGQTYLLAYKPRSLAAIREANGPLHLLQFLNPVLGFESRHYSPATLPDGASPRRQTIFVGVTVDVQAIIDATLGGSSSGIGRWGHAIGHGLFEFVNLPFSTLPAARASRSPGGSPSPPPPALPLLP